MTLFSEESATGKKTKRPKAKTKFEVRNIFFHSAMEVSPEYIIVTWTLPHLTFQVGDRCPIPTPAEVAAALLYELKTDCQWRFLPIQQLLPHQPLSWQRAYYHFNEWRKRGAWKRVCLCVLHQHRQQLELSSVQPHGSQTPVKNSKAAVGYQDSKASLITSMPFLADNSDQPRAVATPQADSPYNVFELGRMFAALCDLLTHAGLCMNGLFLNADKPFDTHELRRACADCGIAANIARNRWTTDWQTDDNTPLDPELYRHRLVIEQMNT